MGYHICISNEDVINISVQEGVYGNVGNNRETRNTIWGKIKDLYAVKPGDLILLYVKNPVSEFRGVYKVISVPYIASDNIFQDSQQIYPLRFNFEIHLYFPNSVPAFEFYSLVEAGKIESMISLARDVNSSYRGIRQLFESEFKEMVQLFYKYNPKTIPTDFQQISSVQPQLQSIEAVDFDLENFGLPGSGNFSLLFNKIPFIGSKVILEDVLHAYIVYNVLHHLNGVREKLGLSNFNELILEAPVFKSMQYRSDILATFKHDQKIFFYSFFELKKDKKVGINDISQLLGYLKSFAASKALPVNSVEGVYISSRFDADLVDYLEKRKVVEKENIISLVSYKIDETGEVGFHKLI